MGYNNSGETVLVVMTNKDVYNISLIQAEKLAEQIRERENLFEGRDVKNGKRLKLQIPHVSSIVIEEAKNA